MTETEAFVVESEAFDAAGVRRGVFRYYVATEERAREIVAQLPDERTYRKLVGDEIPQAVRTSLERADCGNRHQDMGLYR